jgi:hypothetical protein
VVSLRGNDQNLTNIWEGVTVNMIGCDDGCMSLFMQRVPVYPAIKNVVV